jgi:hypothetical protein
MTPQTAHFLHRTRFPLGNLEIVRENIDEAIVIVILLSVSPVGFHLLKAGWKRRRRSPAPVPTRERTRAESRRRLRQPRRRARRSG